MANFLRTIVSRSSYEGVSGRGILQSSFGSQKLFSFVPNLLLNSLIKCSSVNSPQNQPPNFQDFRYKVKYDNRWVSKLEQINLNTVNYSGWKEGTIINTFQKIFKVCEKSRDIPTFKNELKQFTHKKDFIIFCKNLEKKLPTLSPGALLALIDIEIFQMKVTSSLIPKLFDLILDNFNKLTMSEVVYLNAKFSQSEFNDSVHWKNIQKACEVYFKERFEFDLLNCNFSPELLTIMELEVVPDSVRSRIARTLLNEAYLNNCNHKEMIWVIHALCYKAHALVPRDELLRLIKKCSYTFFSPSLTFALASTYTDLLRTDDSFYDKEILTLLSTSGFKKLISIPSKIKFAYHISSAGFYNKDFVSFICAYVQSRSSRTISGKHAVIIASTLARYSFHETESEEDVRIVRKLLSEVDHFKSEMSFFELCTLCEFLTYLGCDTRSLITEIFTAVIESPSPVSEKNILNLLHLAKAYHSTLYDMVPEELCKVLLADEFEEVQSFSVESLTPYFSSEDYVLKNCTTSDSLCLHFVSLFGADNKPISLSDYKEKQLNLPISQFLKIEDIQRPPGSKMVVFQVFTEEEQIKFLNEPRLTGIAKMNLKMFENLDCSIIFLPQKFFTLAPEAREKFLKTQIDEVIEDSKSSQATALEQ